MTPATSSGLPLVTIYVASLDTAAATELCLRSIARHTRDVPHRVVVGDSGSVDGSLPMLVRQMRAGRVAELELAAEGRSHGEWLDRWTASCRTPFAAFVDSDVEILEDGWLGLLVATAERAGAACVPARLIPEQPGYVDHTGVARRLAPRPSAWMTLIDVARSQGRGTWRFGMREDPSIPEGRWGLDTGAAYLLALEEAGERVEEAPAALRRAFRHYGALTWARRGRARDWRARGLRATVAARRTRVALRLAMRRRMDGGLTQPGPGGAA